MIQAALVDTGWSYADLAADLELTAGAVARSIGTQEPRGYIGRRVRARVSEILGRPVAELWPEVT